MGNSLHNKIYLGRSPLRASRRLQLLLAVAVTASIGLAWLTFRTFK